MAAYASLLSVTQTIDHIQNHPHPPISFDQKQLHSLTQNLTFLQDFLESFSTQEDEQLEGRIADAAYAAEDVIETHIVDQIHAKNPTSVYFSLELDRVIKDMDLIKNEVMKIDQQKIIEAPHHNQLQTNSSVRMQSNKMAEFDDSLMIKVLDKLMGQRSLQIISIVGMGGIGKTTLARFICSNPLIVQHFDILAWVTISQECSGPEILLQVLSENNKGIEMNECKLGERVHKKLWGRRYLIVMDDIWSVEPWDRVKFFFPDNDNGSRIMITTRLSNLALILSGSHIFQLSFLDVEKSWDLLCKIVFGKELGCPVELVSIGREIARSCRGLPLSLVVMGGLLKRSSMTEVNWRYILENINSLIHLENDEYCLQVLRTSYKELPVHLKPCFLYLGIFPEDQKIKVLDLIKMWVAEGILKPIDGKSLEEAGAEYVKELIDRNLILAHENRWSGEAKFCKIHDLLRDVCIREAQKHRFLCILDQHNRYVNDPQGMSMERRICINNDKYSPRVHRSKIFRVMECVSLARSLVSVEPTPSFSSKLMRVCRFSRGSFINVDTTKLVFEQVNLRYICIKSSAESFSCSLLWNVQTVEVDASLSIIFPPSFDIWKMPLLRHAKLGGLHLMNPPKGEDTIVLKNLQTLSRVGSFECSEEMVKRIPNVRRLKLKCIMFDFDKVLPNSRLISFGDLTKLESLNLEVPHGHLYLDDETMDSLHEEISHMSQHNITFPHSLRKLSLRGTMFDWEELTMKIGPLPHLEVLKLKSRACGGEKWETEEGQFCSLKFLQIQLCPSLKYWETDGSHFPRLEHLILDRLQELEEIPSSLGDIPMLKSIELVGCSKSAAESARRIKEEQEENGNDELQVLLDKFRSNR